MFAPERNGWQDKIDGSDENLQMNGRIFCLETALVGAIKALIVAAKNLDLIAYNKMTWKNQTVICISKHRQTTAYRSNPLQNFDPYFISVEIPRRFKSMRRAYTEADAV